MILNVICDKCGQASATRVVSETRWSHAALCEACHEGVDHQVIYGCRLLYPNLKSSLRGLVAENPGLNTTQLVKWVVENVAVPVLLPPFDSAIREALRDRSCFRPIKAGGNALRYELVQPGEESSA